jgi:6-phosphogluconolactonase
MIINNKEVLVFKDINEIADYALTFWQKIAAKAVRDNGRFSTALSGGTTPAALFEKLSSNKELPWGKTHIFMVDERFVPYQDKNSNYRMINETLLRHVNVPAINIHPILSTTKTPQEAAIQYEKDLDSFFGSGNSFDLVLLGIGNDGHTASLFPGMPSLDEKEHRAIAVPPSGPIEAVRITITFPIINSAKKVVFMAAGSDKARVIREVLKEEKSRLPAAMVRPAKYSPVFLLDEGAASLL